MSRLKIEQNRFRLCSGLFGLLALAGVGCSSAPTDSADGAVIKLGFFARTEEGFNDSANIALILLALREVNASGGLVIGGERYSLDLETAEYSDASPASASALFDELVGRGVKAVLGPPWSSQVLDSTGNEDGVWRRAVEHETVMISESATNTRITALQDEGYVFRMMPPDSIQGVIAAEEAFERGHRKVAILRRDDAYASGLSERFVSAFEELGGTVTAEVAYDVAGPSELLDYEFAEELDAVFADEPDLVYLLAFDEAATISQRIDTRGDLDGAPSDFQFLAPDALYDLGILEACPESVLVRMIGTTPGVDEDSTTFQEFGELLAEAGLGKPWNASAQLYDAAYLVALAMQAADSYEAKDFRSYLGEVSRQDEGDATIYLSDFARAREALQAGQGVNYEGASGPIELNEAGDPAAGTYLVWSVKLGSDGSLSLVTDEVIPFGQ